MFFMTRPTEQVLRRFVDEQGGLEFSYPDVGVTRVAGFELPRFIYASYDVDHYRIKLGEGLRAFERAKAALLDWKMFDLRWVQLLWPNRRIEEGVNVGVLAQPLGFWSLNACRVVYLVSEDAEDHRFGFAYGTLPDHAASGEERFLVEYTRSDDSVWYDLLAVSRPNHWLVEVGRPAARAVQRRFGRESQRAMVRASARASNRSSEVDSGG